MARYKVLYTDSGIGDISVESEFLKQIDAEVIMGSGTDEETLIREGKDCDGVMVEYAMVTKKVLDSWGEGKVKIISRQGIGYNNIDVDAATENHIMVANVPDYCLDEVADHTLTLSLCVSREIKSFNERVNRGEWEEKSIRPIHRFGSQNFCLFGIGNIGRKVVARAQAFGFNVFAYDPFVQDEEFKKLCVKKAGSLEELAGIADILSIHAPLTDKTKHAINLDIFKLMKKSSIIVNTSRGPLIKEEDLEYAIRNDLIAGAGLDVLENEPPSKKSVLLSCSNVIVTPHVAFYSEEAEAELRMRIAENIALALTEGKPRSLVNKKALIAK
ncbi:MAG: C-terminal binding protein [Eubacteriales bacterium]|nr:C-terminal binding protein [Eubacteriales bacterium]